MRPIRNRLQLACPRTGSGYRTWTTLREQYSKVILVIYNFPVGDTKTEVHLCWSLMSFTPCEINEARQDGLK